MVGISLTTKLCSLARWLVKDKTTTVKLSLNVNVPSKLRGSETFENPGFFLQVRPNVYTDPSRKQDF